jgi:hypothetical protein
LARNVQLGAEGDRAVVLTFDNRGQALRCLYDASLHEFKTD